MHPATVFPRSIERGLIEAITRMASDQELRAFRAPSSAASLKPIGISVSCFAEKIFPRSIERGLIEAYPRISEIERGQGFPRSIERGLIEARG